jgi:hypothetical protein
MSLTLPPSLIIEQRWLVVYVGGMPGYLYAMSRTSLGISFF